MILINNKYKNYKLQMENCQKRKQKMNKNYKMLVRYYKMFKKDKK